MRTALWLAAAAALLAAPAVRADLDHWSPPSPPIGGNTFKAVAFGAGVFATVGDGGAIMTSPDGTVWTNRGAGTGNALNGLTRALTQFVAVGTNGVSVTSANGTVWTTGTTGAISLLEEVAWNGTLLVAAGTSGTILTSPNGTAWTSRVSGLTTPLNSVAANSTLFVAVGTNGIILTSPNGTTWTPRVSGTATTLYAVTWSGTLFVAVGANGVILTSPDGVAWTSRTSGTSNILYAVTWGTTEFVAVGAAGAVVSSLDGITWQVRTSGTGSTFYGVAWNGTKFVAVGAGVILSAVADVVAPVVQKQPANVVRPVGSAAAFLATIVATPAPAFRWQMAPAGSGTFTNITNGGQFSGATTQQLIITGVTAAMSGNRFRVFASNPGGGITSNVATLLVGTVPAITTQPVSQTQAIGGTATFTVVASGTAPLEYQWRKNNVNLAGETAATLTINPVAAASAGSYIVTVKNGVGSVTSKAATLTVPLPPGISVQPANVTVLAPGAAAFRVTGTGTAPLTYQWQRFNGAEFVNLANGAGFSGVTTAAMRVSPTSLAVAGAQFRCVVNNAVGPPAMSAAATLTVNVRPAITGQPLSLSRVVGESATFSVTALGTAPLQYQWKKNNVILAGETGASLTIDPVAAASAGTYTVVVKNTFGTVTSKGARLTVITPPAITVQPVNAKVVAPAAAAFRVTATGTARLTYQWQRSVGGGAFTNLTNGGGFAGVTTAALRVSPTSVAMSGDQFRCVVNNPSAQPATSNPATLLVGTRPAITTQPLSQSKGTGQTATFAVVATGTAPLTYQWKKNNVVLPGETGATLTINSLVTGNAGSYTVAVANDFGTVTSRAARLTVTVVPVMPPMGTSITSPPAAPAGSSGPQAANAGLYVGTYTAADGTIAELSLVLAPDGAVALQLVFADDAPADVAAGRVDADNVLDATGLAPADASHITGVLDPGTGAITGAYHEGGQVVGEFTARRVVP